MLVTINHMFWTLVKLWHRMDLGSNPDSVILSKFLNFSELQFPCLQSEHNRNASFCYCEGQKSLCSEIISTKLNV